MQEVTNVQRLSKRVAGLKPSGIRKFFDIAATMKDVISLGIGEPDFTTPKPILEAGIRSLQNGETHYTSNWGKLELRQAIAENLAYVPGELFSASGMYRNCLRLNCGNPHTPQIEDAVRRLGLLFSSAQIK